MADMTNIHTCHCPCRTGGDPMPDFVHAERKDLEAERDQLREEVAELTRLHLSEVEAGDRVEAENAKLRRLCGRAARHLRTLPVQSDWRDGLMATELEEASRP